VGLHPSSYQVRAIGNANSKTDGFLTYRGLAIKGRRSPDPERTSDMTAQPYSQLIHVKQWADRGLHEFVGTNIDRLSPEDGHIVVRILDHMHVVDRIFQHHLQGRSHAFKAARSDLLPDIAQLAAEAKAIGDWYVSYVDHLSEQELDKSVAFVFTSGKSARMTRGEIILHVGTHGAYHRGNAGILFQRIGIAPHRDGITDYLEAAG
jgi:uncharacterized damage-inducible protein DinB